jgi:hypothetical protein
MSPKALHDQGRLHVIDVHDHGERQQRLEGVARDEADLRQIFIETMIARRGLRPFQDEVRRRHHCNIAGIGVERIFSRQKRAVPDAAEPGLHEFAVPVGIARDVRAGSSREGDDDADGADFDDGLLDELDRREQTVDIVRAVRQHLVLTPAIAAGLQEFFGVLEIVVEVRIVGGVADRWGDDLALRQSRAVVHRHDADHIVGVLDDDGFKAAAALDQR